VRKKKKKKKKIFEATLPPGALCVGGSFWMQYQRVFVFAHRWVFFPPFPAYTFLKLPQLVLQNRHVHAVEPAVAASEPTKMTDWFSIRCAELPWISELVQAWKKDQKLPMNIFIFCDAPVEAGERVLLEHWQCVYTQKSNTILQGSDVKALYNKFVIMFRSLYIYLKVI
jgi:hypothetical protein